MTHSKLRYTVDWQDKSLFLLYPHYPKSWATCYKSWDRFIHFDGNNLVRAEKGDRKLYQLNVGGAAVSSSLERPQKQLWKDLGTKKNPEKFQVLISEWARIQPVQRLTHRYIKNDVVRKCVKSHLCDYFLFAIIHQFPNSCNRAVKSWPVWDSTSPDDTTSFLSSMMRLLWTLEPSQLDSVTYSPVWPM